MQFLPSTQPAVCHKFSLYNLKHWLNTHFLHGNGINLLFGLPNGRLQGISEGRGVVRGGEGQSWTELDTRGSSISTRIRNRTDKIVKYLMNAYRKYKYKRINENIYFLTIFGVCFSYFLKREKHSQFHKYI